MATSWTPKGGDGEPTVDGGGLWNRLPDLRPDRNGESLHKSNGFLENEKGERVWMWVNNVEANFSMAGSTAQSRLHREFYAHNFAQPSITVACQTPNTYEYNRLGAFIREGQKQSMVRQGEILKLRILAAGDHNNEENQLPSNRFHRAINVDGYVMNAPRGAERFVNAPTYQFEFIITRAYAFLGLEDDEVQAAQLRSILQIIRDPKLEWEWEEGKPFRPESGNGRGGAGGGGGHNPKGNDTQPDGWWNIIT